MKLVTGQPVLVRNLLKDMWRYNIFSHAVNEHNNVCLWGTWPYCIPYEGNEHLVGTTDDPDTQKACRNVAPCPWCGEFTYFAIHRRADNSTEIARVQCSTCYCAVESASDALDAWNNLPRRGDANLDELIAEIRAAHSHHG